MNIYWEDEKTKELFQNEEELRKKGLDQKEIKNLRSAMDILKERPSINKMPRRYNCHPIKGTDALHYALDLPSVGSGRGKNRIILKPVGNFDKAHIETITNIEIIGIKNYHD